jgi:hypothetical protein
MKIENEFVKKKPLSIAPYIKMVLFETVEKI